MSKKPQALIGNQSSIFQPTQFWFLYKRFDRSVAGRGSEQVYIFEVVAEPQVRQPRVGYSALPADHKAFQIWQVWKELETTIGNPSTGIISKIELLDVR